MDRRVTPVVERILKSVRTDGDKTLRQFAANFDGLTPQQPFRVTDAEMQAALAFIPTSLRNALETAATNIRAFASAKCRSIGTPNPPHPECPLHQKGRPLVERR
jgi:histidinol dehydrogenase